MFSLDFSGCSGLVVKYSISLVTAVWFLQFILYFLLFFLVSVLVFIHFSHHFHISVIIFVSVTLSFMSFSHLGVLNMCVDYKLTIQTSLFIRIKCSIDTMLTYGRNKCFFFRKDYHHRLLSAQIYFYLTFFLFLFFNCFLFFVSIFSIFGFCFCWIMLSLTLMTMIQCKQPWASRCSSLNETMLAMEGWHIAVDWHVSISACSTAGPVVR